MFCKCFDFDVSLLEFSFLLNLTFVFPFLDARNNISFWILSTFHC